MRKAAVPLLFGIGLALLAAAFSTRGKEGLVAFFLGAAIVLCTLTTAVIHRFGGRARTDASPPTDMVAITGALVGLVLGGMIGARSTLGALLIATFVRDLPERDFGAMLGGVAGGLLGAAITALLASSLAPRGRR